MWSVSIDSSVDPRLQTFQAVLDPQELCKQVLRSLATQWRSPRSVRIKVLKYHPENRCTVEIQLQSAGGCRSVVGKLYMTDRSDVYQAMTAIVGAGFGPEEAFTIPRPLAYVPEIHLLLHEKVQGPLVKDILLKGTESERAAATKCCARWLARFQMLAPASGPVLSNTDLPGRERSMKHFTRRAPSLADKACLLFERLKAAVPTAEPAETCASHCDYSHHNMILSKTSMVVLDWDNHATADPSFDVAKFIISVKQLALQSLGSIAALDPAIDAFCNAYTEASRFQVAARLPMHKAAVCLKQAQKYAKPGRAGIEKAEAILDEGLRILAEEA